MYTKFYELQMVSGNGKLAKKFNTYEEAYDYMCKNYCREISEGYEPTIYRIIMTTISTWKGTTNTMVQPV